MSGFMNGVKDFLEKHPAVVPTLFGGIVGGLAGALSTVIPDESMENISNFNDFVNSSSRSFKQPIRYESVKKMDYWTLQNEREKRAHEYDMAKLKYEHESPVNAEGDVK